MVASLAVVPASGSVVNTISACRITVSGADDTDFTTYNASHQPTEVAIPYVIVARKSGIDSLSSVEFNVSSDGHFVWDNLIFPDDGVWTVELIDQRDDSVDASLSVTVTA